MLMNKNLNKILLSGILTGIASNSVAAETPSTASEPIGDVMIVHAPEIEKKAGSSVAITADDMQKHGGNDFGTIMRYQPLISATGSSGGASNGKSGFDRGGYTGYNIRGIESNRVAIDANGIALPNATGRSYASRAGFNTFGMGRDYIDPYLYGRVDIESGVTPAENAINALGGSVSFRAKSADDYLNANKREYFGFQSDYDSANRGWHNGITAASGDDELRGIVVLSRRDGQQTRNNSDDIAAYPANWHSNAFLASGIWQPNDEHQFTGTVDYYHKTNHTRYDYWGNLPSSNTIYGTAQQSSQTRRWSVSLKDRWTPLNNTLVDLIDSRIYFQNSESHDNTWLPATTGITAADSHRVYSDYNVKTYGLETHMVKNWDRHEFSWGINASQTKTERPFRQDPNQTSANNIMQPEADSNSYTVGGFVQDTISWDLAGHAFSVVPAARAVHQRTKPANAGSMSGDGSVINESDVNRLYGKANSDTQFLPSLSFLYDITPKLTTYVQYRRGAQFPDASQLYGSTNLDANFAGPFQYAFIGNSDLKTETSNNVEWGLKGELTEGVTFRTALFYNTYKNFIANTRYSRSANPNRFTNVPSNINTIYQAENRDKAYIYGGEISSKINFGTWFPAIDGLSTTLAFGYTQGQSKSRYLGDRYIDLDSVAPMKAVIGIAYDDPSQRYGAALTSTFQKGKQAQDTNRQNYNNSGSPITVSTTEYMRVPGYGMVDLTAYCRVLPNVKLSGGVYNLTDRKYWDYLSSRQIETTTAQDRYDQALAVQPGRTFQLGVNVDF
ncbi:hemoglobin/transferrin/lactoferrin receptor protein|uniref:Hemoglobin/transferrin/lactoferrin receptor protein n=3 Tax=Enterobacterales TaxID=91347 RepID=A0A366I9Z5_9GAMM|nr:TonB-dependent receptor [Brenneria salicis]NMN93101.1 hemoglobin/transferrin/lactoferrin receptor protein [Brenneria salicis ATCC 15712 = DSM 30166]RBP65180.1 hemoglobin/transferrin/lactoferrin receptor protein [Brenneria salicis ATCC 15712 = DSM 30166]RLM31682.1 TonB-dependent receptor [Brenneria salicis ATCC 15712 = DSM 30166]